jgi:hypothetical protein
MSRTNIYTREQLHTKAFIVMKTVLAKAPLLHPDGFGKNLNLTLSVNLLDKPVIEEFIECYIWLSSLDWQTRINTSYTSSNYKRIVQNLTNRPIRNGALIAAAVALDMPYKRVASSPHIYLPISERDIKFAKRGYDASREDVIKRLSEWVFYSLGAEEESLSGCEEIYSKFYLRKIKEANRPGVSLVVQKKPKEYRFQVRLDLNRGFSSAYSCHRNVLTLEGAKLVKKILKIHPARYIEDAEENGYLIRASYNNLEFAVEVANKLSQIDDFGIWKASELPRESS